MEAHTPAWEKLANELARDFCPEIRACAYCGGPYAAGFRCNRCYSLNPEGFGKPKSKPRL